MKKTFPSDVRTFWNQHTKGIFLLLALVVIALAVGAKSDSGTCLKPTAFGDTTSIAMKRFNNLSEPNELFKLESSMISENGCLAYGVVRQSALQKKTSKVYGEVYDFKTKTMMKERARNEGDVRCVVQKSSQNFREEYLCDHPAGGADQVFGKLYAFDALTGKTFRNDCRIFSAPGKQKECSNWVQIK